MPKSIRLTLLIVGILFSLALVSLRAENILASAAGDLGMFSGLLGYESPKHYAIILFNPPQDPLLFLVTVSEGAGKLDSVSSARELLKNMPKSNFTTAADLLTNRLLASKKATTLDAIGFTTMSAAGEITDAFGGISIQNEPVNSSNLSSVLQQLTASPQAVDTFNAQVSFNKKNLFIHGRALLFAAKDVFSKGAAAVYIKSMSPFKTPCVGACNEEMFQYLNP
jgi:hypothetical protein